MTLLHLLLKDLSARLPITTSVTNPTDPYTTAENEGIARGFETFKAFESFDSNKVPMESPLTTAKTVKPPGDNIYWGYSATTVRGSPHSIVASLFHEASNESATDNDVERAVLEAYNEHSHVTYLKKTSPFGVHDRDFVYSTTWKKIDSSNYIVVYEPTERSDRPVLPDVVRATSHLSFKIKRLSQTETKIERVQRLDPGGNIPSFVAKFFTINILKAVDRIRDNFQATRSLETWCGEEDRGKGDGVAVGHLLTTPTDAEKDKTKRNKHATFAARRTDFLFANNQGLADVQTKYPFYKHMVLAMLLNEWSTPADVDASLEALSPDSGYKIGGALTYFLLTTPTAEVATDKWIAKFSALTELAALEPWFRPMVVTMTQNIMDEIPFALKLKLFVGAALSIVDMATDARMVFAYRALGEYFYAYSLIAMLIACLVLQLMIVCAQNARAPRGVLLREMIYVLTLVKPGVDAMRCARKEELDEFKQTDEISQMAFCKTIEMFCESIPGSILQTLAMLRIFLRGGGVSKTAVASLLISALTTSFSSTVISFNYDTDADKRATQPDFYGYIPAEPVAQAKMFLTMMVNSTLLIILKCLSAALIVIVGSEYYTWYLSLDLALYFLQKLIRNDVYYWPPVHGVGGVMFAVIGRSLPKIVADFTAIAQFRGPGELGGIYWTINLVVAVLIAFGSVPFYFAYANTEEDVKGLDKWTTEAIMSAMCSAFILTFAYFVYQMDPKYRRTFSVVETGCQWVQNYFLKGETDEVRAEIVMCNYNMWKSIRPEVVEWFHENWGKWADEKPKWFTGAFKKRLDDDLLPKAVLRALKEKYGEGGRRRSSLGEIMVLVGGGGGGGKEGDGKNTAVVVPVE
jgi:hypothetical protein